ncbi:MAG: AlpA family phage regulatory protein [Aeromonadaceae bacterium]|nr:AlpA family phage regulatory protein [Aeromonadaceae bacterium]
MRLSQILPNPKAGHRGIVPVSTATLWRWVSSGKFPKPVKLSERVTVWRVEDIRAWMDAQGKAA